MNARETALHVVRDVFPAVAGSERGAQDAMEYRSRKAQLDARDRAFATELAYGAIKMRRTLDFYLEPFIGERPQPPPPAIHEILRLALYELVFTRADEHATVFEFVNLAKKYGHRGVANLVNAVLRGFLRDRPPAPMRASFESEDEYFGVAYSLPTWLVKQWRTVFGDAMLEAICAAVNDPARSAITANPLLISRDALVARLIESGIAAEPSPYVEDSVLLSDASYATRNEAQAQGRWWTQSESSAMPAAILHPHPAERVLDVCSGRGNKALQLGSRLAGEGALLCVERDQRKAVVLERRLETAGIAAGIVVGDATGPILGASQRFDRILLDAPCSGTGVVGRHPEARWKKQLGDGERLAHTQRALLDACSSHAFEGGALVYAVCSTDPRETTEVVNAFLERHHFERGLIPGVFEPFLSGLGDVVVPPGLGGRDGFYIARLERAS